MVTSPPTCVPVSFGYTGDAVYFAFVRADPPNTKFEYITDGGKARLLVTDIEDTFDWRSVAVTGPVRAIKRRESRDYEDLLSEIDDRPDRSTERGRGWGTLLETLDENPWFSPDYERAGEVSELKGWRLEPEEVVGVELRGDVE